MTDRFDEFLSQAKNARERAMAADGDFKRQWQMVAEMWELLAKEHRRIRKDASDGRGEREFPGKEHRRIRDGASDA